MSLDSRSSLWKFKVCVCAFVHACMCEWVSVCVLPNVNNDIIVFLPTDSMEIHGLRQIVLETHFPGAFQRHVQSEKLVTVIIV